MSAFLESVHLSPARTQVARASRSDREALRARLLLRAVVPTLEVLTREQCSLGRAYRGVTATVHLGVAGHSDWGVAIHSRRGEISVHPSSELKESTQRWIFKDAAACNAFFLGRSQLPQIEGAWRHPFLLVKTLRLLQSLNVLRYTARCPPLATERSVRVRAMLELVCRSLVQLQRGGHRDMVSLVAQSPERVYQWTVGDPRRVDSIAMYLRMASGQIQMGHGLYRKREPFVHINFRDVHAAFDVFTGNQALLRGLQSGALQLKGSPEYSRKIVWMMQRVEELLLEGNDLAA